ncbi:MAG: SDR family oxidoreductase [Proteobacteria bacterium]|nr:SDR family oxidoreductase [Pseudomonadota bacterium]MDA1298581.1 SDR family oxidoreductase [Pseudomonadota bacterium]
MNRPALSYQSDATAIVVGVGLMGQHMARQAPEWLGLRKLLLVDHARQINDGGTPRPLADFATEIAIATGVEVVAESIDVTSESDVSGLFSRHRDVRYLLHTAGISPKPLTPPEHLTKEDIMGACEVNLWGAQNIIKQGVLAGAFTPRAHGVIILSTSATVGSEGRASAAYEVSKGGLMNFLQLQSRYLLETHGLVLNGLAPSPLRGPMAAQNPISAARLQAVEDEMPIGGLTDPSHIAAAAMYFWSNECWCVGEVLTIDGGYTKHKPVYGPL